MQITNIAGYKFIPLSDLADLQNCLLQKTLELQCKGTILLSTEGININLAGVDKNISAFKNYLLSDSRFADISFKITFSEKIPFRYMRVKIKKEIITMKCKNIHAEISRAPAISPTDFKKWLDENKDITIVDTRNDYEIQFGTFANAVNLKMSDFSEFPQVSTQLPKEKPIVMFCTGGIRCEKAALHLQNEGYENVFQLEGGILNYFQEVGDAHFQGECFVFDERVSLNANLEKANTQQCKICEGPIFQGEELTHAHI